jgi:putative serine protease PepD
MAPSQRLVTKIRDVLRVSHAILKAGRDWGCAVDVRAGQGSTGSSESSGALYDPSTRGAAHASGAPQSPLLSPGQAGASPWWSDGANDPWRDPQAPAALVVAAPVPAEAVEPPDFTPHGRGVGLSHVLIISIVSALLAGALGGALGYVAAVRGGAAGGSSLAGGGSGTPALAQRAPTSLAGVVRNVLPSVVTVRVDGDFGSAIGTGFIVSSDGYLITNDHVVDGLTGTATITFSNASTAPATLVGADTQSDIAVLKVAKTGLPAVTFGDSDAIAVGDPVLAIGSPLDLPNTVTYGIISALHRPLEVSDGGGPTRYYAAIQTDAAVNHGNSGGPLVDAAGRVIGIDAVIKSLGSNDEESGNIGLAFAIPIDQARRVAQAIINGGKVARTVIGATVQASYENPNGGVLLTAVSAGGPADVAGIKSGDVIVEVGGSPLSVAGDLTALVREYPPGAVVPVVYTRGGATHTVQVKLAVDNG